MGHAVQPQHSTTAGHVGPHVGNPRAAADDDRELPRWHGNARYRHRYATSQHVHTPSTPLPLPDCSPPRHDTHSKRACTLTYPPFLVALSSTSVDFHLRTPPSVETLCNDAHLGPPFPPKINQNNKQILAANLVSTAGNTPYYTETGELWCPFHMYRSGGDGRPRFGAVLYNLEDVLEYTDGNLSVPGCWAYPDMLEVGVTNVQLPQPGKKMNCGVSGEEPCPPLSKVEARSHFGACKFLYSSRATPAPYVPPAGCRTELKPTRVNPDPHKKRREKKTGTCS